jgi:flagellar motor switch protein FliN/FliY
MSEEEISAAMEADIASSQPPVWQEPRGALEQTGDVDLDVILQVPVTLTLEVGRTRLPIRSLLQLNQGSVVELERAAGEPLDVHVNGTLVAHGEVVLINEKFGIRLVDVISPADRIRTLK